MRSNGLYGFRYKDKDYLCLNQMSSEYTGLGEHIFSFVKDLALKPELLEKMKTNLTNIEFVKMGYPITEEQKKYLNDFHNEIGLSDEKNINVYEWASFFSQEEGNIDMFLDGFKYMLNWEYMMKLSKTTNFAYLINLDNNMFEIYIGNNEHGGNKGRYASLQHETMGEGYFGMILIKEIALDSIKENDMLKSFLS